MAYKISELSIDLPCNHAVIHNSYALFIVYSVSIVHASSMLYDVDLHHICHAHFLHVGSRVALVGNANIAYNSEYNEWPEMAYL